MSNPAIVVMEVWHFKPDLETRVLELMQNMDDMVGPPAHEHPGWCGHASFYQSAACPTDVVMLYPWRSRELHEDLVAQEKSQLNDFYKTYCTTPREIHYYTELPVEVEQDKSDDRPN